MGKDLHYSIRPFIEEALNSHSAVESLEEIKVDGFFAYMVHRRKGLSSLILVLSDAYHFGKNELLAKPKILKDGGFLLIAKPEARGDMTSIPDQKLGIGQLRKLMGALNKEDYWNYEPKE